MIESLGRGRLPVLWKRRAIHGMLILLFMHTSAGNIINSTHCSFRPEDMLVEMSRQNLNSRCSSCHEHDMRHGGAVVANEDVSRLREFDLLFKCNTGEIDHIDRRPWVAFFQTFHSAVECDKLPILVSLHDRNSQMFVNLCDGALDDAVEFKDAADVCRQKRL